MEETQAEISFLDFDERFKKSLEKKRWGILCAIFFYTFTNQATWCTYSPISGPTEVYYNISSADVNWFINSYSLTYTLFSFLGSWFIYNKFAFALTFGALLNALGSWIRYFGKTKFSIALLGQFLMGISYCLVLEAPLLISQRWFHSKERFFVVTTLILAGSLGCGLGFLIPALFVGEDASKIEPILLIEAICCSIPLPFLIFLKDRPEFAPNLAENMKKPKFFESLKKLLKNPKYIFAMLAFSTISGNAWDLFSILGNLLDSTIVSNETIGMLGVVSAGVSVFVSFAINYCLSFSENSSKYVDIMMKILFSLGFFGFVFFSLTVQYQNVACLYIIMIILGSSALSISPLCCICLEELTFPIPETLSVNFMFFTSNLFSFIITILVSLPQIKKYGSWIFPATLFPFLIYILFWYKTDFFKSEHEGLCGSFNPKHIKEKNAVMKEFTPKQEKFEKTQDEIEITSQID